MTRIALPFVALALLVGAATVHAASSLATEMEAVERARFQTWTKGDIAAMQAVLADDVVYCHSNGQCQTKKEFIADIQSRQRLYKTMNLVSMTAKTLGPDSVLINGTVDVVAESPRGTVQFRGIYTDVYVKRSGRWQLLSWQSTSLPGISTLH
jgi:uncharacterized protein (TIGR02246 family)